MQLPCPSCKTIAGFPTHFCPACGAPLPSSANDAPARSSTPPARFAAAKLPPLPRSISPELEKQFAEGLGGSRQLFWMAVGFPFILFFLVEGPWKLFTPQGNEDDSISFGVIATVLAFAILVVLASTGVLPPITFAFVAAYLAITVPIGLWLVRSDERSNTQKLAERRRTYEQGRAVDVTIRIVNEIDIGGVRVYGTLGDREFTIDVPEQLKSRVERGGIIEVLEPPPPASPDATIYATALLE